MQWKVNRRLGEGRRQQAWLRSGRRQHEQKTSKGRKEERKKKSTKPELHCEEFAKILAIGFTLYQSENLHLLKSLGQGRPSILSKSAEFPDSEDNNGVLHKWIYFTVAFTVIPSKAS